MVNYVTGNPGRYEIAVVRFGEYVTLEAYEEDGKQMQEPIFHFGFYLDNGHITTPYGNAWVEKVGNIYENRELYQSFLSKTNSHVCK